MFENLDPVLLSRIQFAFTISFHIIFPAFTIGLASWLTVLELRWLQTGKPVYAEVYRMWVKIFAVTFGMGVVSGVVMSFEFGTNWSVFSDRAGNVLGPLLGYEVLTAFFLEASFLGVMLFGWNRVSRGLHFAATVIVAIGTLFSAFWILSANSWMQTPQGFRVAENGILYPIELASGHLQSVLSLPFHAHGHGCLSYDGIRRRRRRRFLPVARKPYEPCPRDARDGHDYGDFRSPDPTAARRYARPQHPRIPARQDRRN